MNKRILTILILWCCFFLWVGMIYFLSSENGAQTAQTSSGIARTVAECIYREPSEQQIMDVHMVIRKTAHVVLFLGLGLLTFWCVYVSFMGRKCGLFWIFLLSVGITGLYGFYDEWHKQFIPGRHFDHGETVMNICSGTAGVLISLLVLVMCCSIRKKTKTKEETLSNQNYCQ